MFVLCNYYRTIPFRQLCAAGRLNIPSVPELNRIAAEAIPCVLITPLDCYWEGSILQEPDDDIAPVDTSSCMQNSPTGDDSNVTWGNIDFDILRQCLGANQSESGFSIFLDAVCLVYLFH